MKEFPDNIKGIIFDFDGTLYDNSRFAFPMIAACPFDLCRSWKERLIRSRFAGCDYSSPEEYSNAFFAALGKACCCPPPRIRDWYFNRYMPRMIRVIKKHYQFRPGAGELLRKFDASAAPRAAVYSDYPLLKERLEALGLSAGSGVFLYGPESFGAQKPAVRPFLRIAADLGAAPGEVLVIGDREETDGLGAFGAGMRFFHLKTGRKRHSRPDPGAPGSSPLMYKGGWDSLYSSLMERFFG